MVKITFISDDGTEYAVDAPVGTSVMRAAIDNNVPGIIADCGGELSCATCHAYIDPAWVSKTGESSEVEDEMLECAIEVQANSRLTCQIKLSEELNGLIVRLPKTQL